MEQLLQGMLPPLQIPESLVESGKQHVVLFKVATQNHALLCFRALCRLRVADVVSMTALIAEQG